MGLAKRSSIFLSDTGNSIYFILGKSAQSLSVEFTLSVEISERSRSLYNSNSGKHPTTCSFASRRLGNGRHCLESNSGISSFIGLFITVFVCKFLLDQSEGITISESSCRSYFSGKILTPFSCSFETILRARLVSSFIEEDRAVGCRLEISRYIKCSTWDFH